MSIWWYTPKGTKTLKDRVLEVQENDRTRSKIFGMIQTQQLDQIGPARFVSKKLSNLSEGEKNAYNLINEFEFYNYPNKEVKFSFKTIKNNRYEITVIDLETSEILNIATGKCGDKEFKNFELLKVYAVVKDQLVICSLEKFPSLFQQWRIKENAG